MSTSSTEDGLNVYPMRLARLEEGLNPKGGGGNSGGMDERIAKLESDMGHVKDTLKSLDSRVEGLRTDVVAMKVDMATLKTSVLHLPTKAFIFSVCLGLLAAVGGVTTLIVRFIPHAP